MAAHITECAAAIIPIAAPFEGGDGAIVAANWGDA